MILKFESLKNSRELGGIKAAGGEIKPMRLFRTARLETASAADLKQLGEYGIKHIFDFRDRTEVEDHPDPAVAGAEHHFIPVLPGLPGKKEMRLEGKTPEYILSFFRSMYKTFAENDICAGAYREFFRIILENAGQPILWHCTQGKDRTGIAALLLLTALGVGNEAQRADYFLTNSSMQEEFDSLSASGMSAESLELMRMMLFVYPECLDGYLDSIRAAFGGLEGYLRQRIGLTNADFDTLRAAYLR